MNSAERFRTTDPLDLFRSLRDRDLRREGMGIAEGRLLAQRIIASDLPILALLCSPRMAREFEASSRGRFPVLVYPEEGIRKIAGFPFHRGVMAAFRRPPLRLPGEHRDELSKAYRLVIAPNITSDENLGSLIRTAAALGYQGLMLGKASTDPWSRRAFRVSMGAPLSLPLYGMGDEEECRDIIKDLGYTVYGTSLAAGARPLEELTGPERGALVFGNEASGLPAPWDAHCDEYIQIPMAAGIDSLNVAVSAGIILYALRPNRLPPAGPGS